MSETIEVLLVGDGPLAERISAVLADAEDGPRFRLSCVLSIDAVRERIETGGADVIVMLLAEGSERAVVRILELRAVAPDVPVVVLADGRHEPLAIKAVHLGAVDYLIGERLYGTLASRCLRHAVEVGVVRSRLRKVEAEWHDAFGSDRTGEAGVPASLRLALPETFAEIVGKYGEILDLAVEQVLYQVERPVDERMDEVAQRLGALWAGPRDVVEIHAAALKKRQQDEGPQRMRLYTAEGRLRVLELMGRLLGYHRRANLHRMGRTGI